MATIRRGALVAAACAGLAAAFAAVTSCAPDGAALLVRSVEPDGFDSATSWAAASALRSASFDEQSFARALAGISPATVDPLPGVRMMVLPHHWPAASLIVGPLAAISATTGGWQRLVVLGPDHRRAGGRVAFTSVRDWTTPYGDVAADPDGVAALMRTGIVSDQPAAMALEHSVAGLVPALRWFLPSASVVPLAIRSDARYGEVATLAAAIGDLVDETTLVIVSADFAHDVTVAEARTADEASIRALRTFDLATVRGFGDEHVDARAALATGMLVARQLGASRFLLLGRTDSSELVGYTGGEVTSYVAACFAECPG